MTIISPRTTWRIRNLNRTENIILDFYLFLSFIPMESPNNFCRLCGTILRGNQRRWLFGRSTGGSRPDLLVVLSYVLSREPPERGDGRGEFLCGKCAQALNRVYRFDTIIARVQALSIDRLQRLLSEKDQLARSLRYIYARRFPDDNDSASYMGQEISASIADLPHVRYQRLLQDDMALSEYECWASEADSSHLSTPYRKRQCRSCHGLRVEDSDYEWVCQTPRRLGMLSPISPLSRDKSRSMPTVHRAGSQISLRSQSLGDADSCSMLSLDTLPEPDLAWEALKALRGIGRKRLRAPPGSRIPVLTGTRRVSTPCRESPVEEEIVEEMVDEFMPLDSKVKDPKCRVLLDSHHSTIGCPGRIGSTMLLILISPTGSRQSLRGFKKGSLPARGGSAMRLIETLASGIMLRKMHLLPRVKPFTFYLIGRSRSVVSKALTSGLLHL